MRKGAFLLSVGFFVFITPFLGIPESWKTVLLFILGACVMLEAILHRLISRRDERCDEDALHTENEPTTHLVGDL
jgi:TRAP-type C4-dicarboxylate transport system permease small subunit